LLFVYFYETFFSLFEVALALLMTR